ncbi:RNA polymerase sigma factor [Sphingobacterium sp. HJSM2_6]|uniref:RNA polymerase sigma factor n=1 Tax=Sphingobacterium sp. HJSM2_6 TaxID=3366264 RepID=UPI003BBD627F
MDNLYIDKVLSGDSHAFRYFVKTYKDMAFSLAISIVKNELLAEEVVQDAFLQAYLSLAQFKKQAKFSTWFYRIVVHCSYSSLKKRSWDTVPIEPLEEVMEMDESIISKLIEEEQKQLIQDALLQLPGQEALALRLFYLEELHLEEITQITGWTLANTKVILHRARKRMSIEVQKHLIGQENARR